MGSRYPSRRVLLTAVVCAFSVAAPGPATASTDKYRSSQWGLDAVDAAAAWTQSSGHNVVVAVVDTGVQIGHPDLEGNVWTNPNEVENGIDDDGNGIVDDVHGANLLNDTGNVSDDAGHGTHIAGIIAARAGNGIGVAGLAPGAVIMPVKVDSDRQRGSLETLAAGIHYAVQEGASIVNVSMNTDDPDPAILAAVQYADEHGATIVASSGNDGRDIDRKPSYPASYPNPSVLSVTATTQDGKFFQGSNWGTKSVDISAPGDMILATVPGSQYDYKAGTSMAAPFVAASLALLEAARPELTQAQLRDALLASAKRTPQVVGRVGAGALDVGAAMHEVLPGRWDAAPRATIGSNGPKLRVLSRASMRLDRKVNVHWSAADADGVTRWLVKLDGRDIVSVSANGRKAAACWAQRAGHHRWTVVGLDAGLNPVVRASRSFRVRA